MSSIAQSLSSTVTCIGASEQVEALHELKGIEDLRELHSVSPSSSLTLCVYYTMALLYCVMHNYAQVCGMIYKAMLLWLPMMKVSVDQLKGNNFADISTSVFRAKVNFGPQDNHFSPEDD